LLQSASPIRGAGAFFTAVASAATNDLRICSCQRMRWPCIWRSIDWLVHTASTLCLHASSRSDPSPSGAPVALVASSGHVIAAPAGQARTLGQPTLGQPALGQWVTAAQASPTPWNLRLGRQRQRLASGHGLVPGASQGRTTAI